MSAQSSAKPASAGADAAALSISGLYAGYGGVTVLRGVSLDVPTNSVVALIGPNGAGKTTLLRSVSGLLPALKGSVSLAGQNLNRLDHFERARLGLCHVPEGRGIYRSLTVRENLRMQVPRKDEADAVQQAVSIFPVLGKRLSQAAGTLSGGEQQMLAMSAAYTRDAKVIVVDEPSLGLAPLVVDAIFAFLDGVPSRGASLLIVDQFVHRALGMAHVAYVMRRGEIVYSGDPATLLGADLFKHYIGG